MSAPAELDTLTNWELVARAQAGDKDAFGTLYRTHRSDVYAFLLWYTKRRVTAEDLTSETFLRALRRIDSISYRGSDVGAWFHTIARNIAKDHLRRFSTLNEVFVGELHPDSHIARDLDPPDEIERRDNARRIAAYVTRLSDPQREYVRQRYYLDHSIAEIAESMGRDETLVKAYGVRARRTLAKYLPEDIR